MRHDAVATRIVLPAIVELVQRLFRLGERRCEGTDAAAVDRKEGLVAYAAKDAVIVARMERQVTARHGNGDAGSKKKEKPTGRGGAYTLRVLRQLHGHDRSSCVTAVAFSDHAFLRSLMASAGSDKRVCMGCTDWDEARRALSASLPNYCSGLFSASTWSVHIWRQVWSCSYAHGNSSCCSIRCRECSESKRCCGKYHTARVSSDEDLDCSSCFLNAAQVQEYHTRGFPPAADSWVSCISASPYNPHIVAVGYQSGALAVLDLRTGRPVRRLVGHTKDVQD